MGKDSKGNPYRAFAKDGGFHKNKNTYGVDNLFRYEDCFKDPDTALELFADIPFLNGGLFECLDRTEPKTEKKIYIDGFSRNKKKRPSVPNYLFFSDEQRMLKTNIREIRDYSRVRVFKDADVYPVVFVCTNHEQKHPVAMTVMESEEITSNTKLISESDFYRDISWARYFASQEGIDIDQRLSKFERFGDFFPTICGAATVAEAYEIREVVKDQNVPSGRSSFRLINTGTIDPYISYWGSQKIRYLKGAFLHPIVSRSDLAAINPRRVQQADSEKLIIGGMTKILECFYDDGGYLAGKSATIVLPGRKLPLFYAAAVLNSRLISYWYRIRFKALTLAGGYLRISPNEIKQIPIPVPSSEDLDNIKRLVDIIREQPNSSEAHQSIKSLDDYIFRIYGFSDQDAELIKRWNP